MGRISEDGQGKSSQAYTPMAGPFYGAGATTENMYIAAIYINQLERRGARKLERSNGILTYLEADDEGGDEKMMRRMRRSKNRTMMG